MNYIRKLENIPIICNLAYNKACKIKNNVKKIANSLIGKLCVSTIQENVLEAIAYIPGSHIGSMVGAALGYKIAYMGHKTTLVATGFLGLQQWKKSADHLQGKRPQSTSTERALSYSTSILIAYFLYFLASASTEEKFLNAGQAAGDTLFSLALGLTTSFLAIYANGSQELFLDRNNPSRSYVFKSVSSAVGTAIFDHYVRIPFAPAQFLLDLGVGSLIYNIEDIYQFSKNVRQGRALDGVLPKDPIKDWIASTLSNASSQCPFNIPLAYRDLFSHFHPLANQFTLIKKVTEILNSSNDQIKAIFPTVIRSLNLHKALLEKSPSLMLDTLPLDTLFANISESAQNSICRSFLVKDINYQRKIAEFQSLCSQKANQLKILALLQISTVILTPLFLEMTGYLAGTINCEAVKICGISLYEKNNQKKLREFFQRQLPIFLLCAFITSHTTHIPLTEQEIRNAYQFGLEKVLGLIPVMQKTPIKNIVLPLLNHQIQNSTLR